MIWENTEYENVMVQDFSLKFYFIIKQERMKRN